MKRFWMGLVVVLMLVATPVFAAEIKIAYVNMQVAVYECDAGKAGQISLNKRQQEVEANLQERQQSLLTLKDDLVKKRVMLSAAAKEEKERDLMQQQKDYERFFKDSREELQREGQRLINNVAKGLVEVIKDLGDKEGYTLVLERSNGVLYADEAIDITDKVIAGHNKLYKANKGK